jgi:hypothetical protein
MNQVETDYAFANRFHYNGKKSNVMVFNAHRALSEQVQNENWMLFGSPVKYLGVDITNNLDDWSDYFNRLLSKAQKITIDLTWICRRDAGLLPRTASTLWKAIVRPVLEYAAEIWAGDINKDLVNRAEKVQINFGRSILGILECQSIPNDCIRAELGLEKLTARWRKIRLGYWRRLHVTNPHTTLHSLVSLRRWKVEWTSPIFNNGWMGKTKKMMQQVGLSHEWYDPNACCRVEKKAWKTAIYELVEESETAATISRLSNMSSHHAARFLRSKNWGQAVAEFACFTGEIG